MVPLHDPSRAVAVRERSDARPQAGWCYPTLSSWGYDLPIFFSRWCTLAAKERNGSRGSPALTRGVKWVWNWLFQFPSNSGLHFFIFFFPQCLCLTEKRFITSTSDCVWEQRMTALNGEMTLDVILYVYKDGHVFCCLDNSNSQEKMAGKWKKL